jgi:2-phospho-L-lactate guanylyltransferase
MTVQATVFDFDESDGSGTVVLDDGERLPFGPQAFAASGLRLLRAGQRVRVEVTASGSVDSLTIVTLRPHP